MWYDSLFKEIEEAKNYKKSVEMASYMKNLFHFLGVQKQARKNICKQYFKNKPENDIDFSFTDKCYNNKYREFQYIAVDYLTLNKTIFNDSHIQKLKEYITTKSWWDTVDGINRIVGYISLHYKSVENILIEWSKEKNIWLRRVAIDHQLLRKNETNEKLLEKIILNNLNSKEFFINKAIGWSLRDYSKTNSKWVKDFIKKYGKNLNNLSVREASKYL